MPDHNLLLANLMKMHAATQGQSYAFSRIAWVKDFDPTTNTVKVAYFNTLTNDWDLLSGWLPILSPSLGKGDDSEAGSGTTWGFVHPPNINEQVVVISRGGDFTNGIVTGALFSDVVPPPNPDGTFTQMGEFLWCHKTGTYVKFLNNGDIFIYVAHDYNLHVKNDGKILIEGNATVEVTGNTDLYVGGEMTAAVTGAATIYGSSLTANVTGDSTLNIGGNVTANVEGNVKASIFGQLIVDSNGNITIASHLGALTLDAFAGVTILARTGNIIMNAAGTITENEGVTLPPLPPVIVSPVPAIPSPPQLFASPPGTPAPTPIPTPTPPPPPSGPPVNQGSGPGIGNLFAFNPTANTVSLQWNSPT
jgi:phage baseplate assembly protein gpV